MAFKFPFTNYHELNLTWVLDQLKKLFEESAENVTVIENYNGRLTAVETELPLVSETAQGASQTAANAASLAQTAKSTADAAQENAIQAQAAAGQARQEAQAAQRAADAAAQAAQQAQATAQNFDGRITQAQNDAAEALEASRSFENRVQAAITTANNAAQTATNAQGIATRADQNAALALDTLNAQRAELERIGAEQAALITEETESGKTEIENLAQSVLDSIPSDYTALSNLVDKKAPIIINSASGSIASFDDGVDDMKIQKLVVNIEPLQAGSGDPSPNNVRPISGWTGAEIEQRGVNLIGGTDLANNIKANLPSAVIDSTAGTVSFRYDASTGNIPVIDGFPIKPNTQYTIILSVLNATVARTNLSILYTDGTYTTIVITKTNEKETVVIASTSGKTVKCIRLQRQGGTTVLYCDECGIFEGVITADDFVPYTGNQISVTFPETIYGGSAEVIGGALESNRGIFKFENYTGNISSDVANANGIIRYIATISDKKAGTSNFISNILATASYVIPQDTDKELISGFPSSAGLYMSIKASRLTGDLSTGAGRATALRSWAEANGFEICYELATPIEYTLAANELNTIYGTNNIWANTGDVEVKYPADTKLYIDGKLAELQATILENI